MGEKRRKSRIQPLLDRLRRLFGKQTPPLPGDPYAYCMTPVRRGPKGRGGAVAVAEPEEDSYRAFPPRR